MQFGMGVEAGGASTADVSGIASLRNALLDLDATLGRECWRYIAPHWHPVRVPRGWHLVRPGLPAERVVFIQRGVMRSYWLDESGRDYTLSFFRENMFALSTMMTGDDKRSEAGIEALTDVVGFSADTENLRRVARSHPGVSELYQMYLERAWASEQKRTATLASAGAALRYEMFLSENANLMGRIPLHCVASFLGVTNVHLSRIRRRRKPSRG